MTDVDLDSLYRVYGPEMEAYLKRQTRCAETSADLLHDAFVRVARSPSFVNVTNIRTYLYSVARNLALDHARQSGRRKTDAVPDDVLGEVPDPSPTSEIILSDGQSLRILKAAILELPALTQEIFRLNRLEGATYRDVAIRLNVSESTVQKHLSKALHHCMRALKSSS